MGIKPKAFKPKMLKTSYSDSNGAKKRHTGSGAAKALGKAAHVSRHSATHIKSRMKRFT